jgi:hypothetical protein
MREPRSDEAIRLGRAGVRKTGPGGVDWSLIRTVYMRVIGLVWLGKGLHKAAVIIGLIGHTFQNLPVADQVSIGFSAIGDCIAGVGMWLTVSWGAVIWIVITVVETVISFTIDAEVMPVLAMLVIIGFYFALSFLNARQIKENA